MKNILVITAAALLVSVVPAFAGQVTSTLTLSADVSAICTVSTNPAVFVGYTGAATVTSSTGDVTVQCSNGVSSLVGLDAGWFLGFGSDGSLRAMSDGDNFLSYKVYSSTFPTVEWGDAGMGGTYNKSNLGVNHDGSAKVIGVIGELIPNLSAVPGSYSDTINVIVQF